MKIYGNMWPRCTEWCSVSLSQHEIIYIYYFSTYICPYYMHCCLFFHFCVMSDRGRCPGRSSFPKSCLQESREHVFLIIHCYVLSTEPGASADHLFQMWENSCLKMKSIERKANLRDVEERQSTADIVQTLRSCHAWSQHTPLDIPFVSQ